MAKKENILRITDTTLRDGHQSLWATRMRTDDMLKIIDTIDNVGYYSLEAWGGATFDVCLRYLYEDPWERLKLIKSKVKNTPLQMLMRGQNIVGYKNYPDDLVERFVKIACKNGIDIFRVFDALNDSRNLETAIKAIKKTGAHAQGTLSYTISPVHTIKKYVEDAKAQYDLGIDSLCIKDMAGLLSPVMAKELVSALKKELKIPIQVHCHSTSGMAFSAYFEAVKAGAGAIDCAVSSLAGFSSQPPVETMIAMFNETEYKTNLDIEAIRKVNQYYTQLSPKRCKGRSFEPIVDSEILSHQIPGGMISNFRSQLEQQDSIEKLPEALEEVVKVRKDLGYPPLVTPTSQIVGTQAVMNVLTGERYKMVPQEVKNYVKGMYGRPPSPIDPKIIKKILGKEKPLDHRPADDIKPILPKATKGISNPKLVKNEEDILSYCLFPEVAMEFFKWRETPETDRLETPAEIECKEIEKLHSTGKDDEEIRKPLLNNEDYDGINEIIDKAAKMQLNEIIIKKGDFNLALKSSNGSNSDISSSVSNYQTEEFSFKQGKKEQKTDRVSVKEKDIKKNTETIDAVMSGTFYRSPAVDKPPFAVEGSVVKQGDKICILEAMKLFNEIESPFKCKIIKFLIDDGDKVTKGQPIMTIEKI